MKNSTSTHPKTELPLDQLKVGESGIVGGFVGNVVSHLASKMNTLITQIDPLLERRLMEIGFIPGEPLQVLHKGFLGGGPIAVRIGQSTFALRRFEAALISVIPHKHNE